MADQQAQKKSADTEERKKLTPEEKMQARVERAKQPSSIVLSPHTAQGNAIADMFYPFDKALNSIRMKAGLYIPVPDVNKRLQAIAALQEKAADIIGTFGGAKPTLDSFAPFEEDGAFKLMLAAQRGSRVFTPRTREVRVMARVLNELDPLIMRSRGNMDDVEKSKDFFEALVKFMLDFHKVATDLCRLANENSGTRERKIEYRIPRAVNDIIGRNNGGKQEETVQ
jgi:hypothetical protein